jgi:HEAT repeat protein
LTSVDELAARLKSPDAKVRRVAAMDLGAAGDAGLSVLLEHLPGEADEKAALLIIRKMGEARHGPALPVLARLRDDRGTPVRVYHAAVLAHDRIERAGGGIPPGA